MERAQEMEITYLASYINRAKCQSYWIRATLKTTFSFNYFFKNPRLQKQSHSKVPGIGTSHMNLGEMATILPITERFFGAILQGEEKEEGEQSLASQLSLSGGEAALPSGKNLPLMRGPLGTALGHRI